MINFNHKAIIISAPSGAGKTTIVKRLMSAIPQLEFSVSACSRSKREGETNGKDYYFMTVEEFRIKITNDEFVEWEEVYPGNFYGTLKSELNRIWTNGNIPIFDVDVIGGLNLKKYFGETGLALFIQPPSKEELENRLRNRNTDSHESLKDRIAKANYELSFAEKFDGIIINDDLEKAFKNAFHEVELFIS